MSRSYTISAENGARFLCRDDQFVLAAMLAARCGPVTHGCCGGGCGVCRIEVVAGAYEAVKPMSRAHIGEHDREQGIVLACCIQPRSDMVIRRV